MKYKYKYLNIETPGREDVERLTPNPANKEMLRHLKDEKVETWLDRYEAQQPQCKFGMRGVCCQRCLMGPCFISKKRKRGICGLDENGIVMGNLLRALAGGTSAHGSHAREASELLLHTARGETDYSLKGKEVVGETARKLGIKENNIEKAAEKVALLFLEDLSRIEGKTMKVLQAYAPGERKKKWKELGILPRSPYHEAFEALHMTTLGGNTDWRNLAFQDLRLSLAYCWGSIYISNLATEMVFGLPKVRTGEVNYGILKEENLNIILHGHSPVMVEKIVEKANSEEFLKKARAAGAQGVQLGGVCCTGHELLARHGIPSLGNILGQELIVGTGAVDAMIVDTQCVIPGLKIVADCYGTKIITTSNQNRIPGAVHLPHNHMKIEPLAEKVLSEALEAYRERDRSNIFIPAHKTRVMSGFSRQAIIEGFGGLEELCSALKNGSIKGIVTMVSCSSAKLPYERNQVIIAKEMVKRGFLVTTTGCCGHALVSAGLCDTAATEQAPEKMKKLLKEKGLPPVLVTGACVDNTRTHRLFIEISQHLNIEIPKLPFFYSAPEPANEKAIGAGMSFATLGVSVHQGFPPGVPVPIPTPKEGAKDLDEMDPNRSPVIDFFAEELRDLLGAQVVAEPYPELAAGYMHMRMHFKRKALGWK